MTALESFLNYPFHLSIQQLLPFVVTMTPYPTLGQKLINSNKSKKNKTEKYVGTTTEHFGFVKHRLQLLSWERCVEHMDTADHFVCYNTLGRLRVRPIYKIGQLFLIKKRQKG